MTNPRLESLVKSADFLNETVRKVIAEDRGLHAETAISAAARMSGTMLFRSFGFTQASLPPGTVLASRQADVDGPNLMKLMFVTLRQCGHDISEDSFKPLQITTALANLSLLQTQERLDPFYMALCKASSMSFRDIALASAVSTGIMIHDFREVIDVQKGTTLALWGIIEGCKSVPRAIADVAPSKGTPYKPASKEKKPWYRLW